MSTPVSIIDVKNFWEKAPCNSRWSTAPEGSLQWSRDITTRKKIVEPHIWKHAEFAKWKGKNVLEIGCGVGTQTLEFLKAGARVDAIDLSSKSVRLTYSRCKAEYEQLGISSHFDIGLEVFICNAEENLPVCHDPRGYDLIYAFGVLHHSPNPRKIIELAYSRLKSGGEFRLMLYAKWSIKHLLRHQPEAQAGCPIVRWYTGDDVRNLLSPYFEITSIEKDHIFKWRLKDYLQHRYVEAFPYSIMSESLFHRLEKYFGHHLLIRARKG